MRHAPEEYLLSLDEEGWVDLEIFFTSNKEIAGMGGLI